MIEMLDKAVAMDIYITCRRADINVRYLDVVTLALDMGGKSQCAVESVEEGRRHDKSDSRICDSGISPW